MNSTAFFSLPHRAFATATGLFDESGLYLTYVLAGTYDLPIFRNLNAQLSRRSIDVHFPRYDATNPEERKAFQKVLLSFQRHLPLEEPPDLIHQWKYFYARSVGCVGILKGWLTKALAEALESSEKTLSPAVLEQYAETADRCDQMMPQNAHTIPMPSGLIPLRVQAGCWADWIGVN